MDTRAVQMKLGRGSIRVSIPAQRLAGVLDKTCLAREAPEERVVSEALANPVGAPRLSRMVSRGDTVCVVVSDITRSWQRMHVFLPLLVRELTAAGVRDEDITFLCAPGHHREQTRAEDELILGEELSARFQLVTHDCNDAKELTHLGTTSRGTPVSINRRAAEADHLVITGGACYHPFAGFAGGRKSVLPGIASAAGILANHVLALGDGPDGQHPSVRGGRMDGNPVHEDMVEAAALARPAFGVNVVIGPDGRIHDMVCGHPVEAHLRACSHVEELYGVTVPARARVTIASQGGYPKDLDYYQAGKSFFNARHCTEPGGRILVLAECAEGLGPAEMEGILLGCRNNAEREAAVRKDFTVPGYVAYFLCRLAERFELGVVGALDPALVAGTGMRVFQNPREGVAWALGPDGDDGPVFLVPRGADVLPTVEPCDKEGKE